jgi:hypothetical protein
LDHTDQYDNDRKHEQQVYETAQRVGAHHTERPEYEQNYRDRPKHLVPAFWPLQHGPVNTVDTTN